MPELPEVETVRRGLEPHLLGRRIESFRARVSKLRFPLDAEAIRTWCLQRPVTGLQRRGKFLVVELDACRAIILHLGMTGEFRVCSDQTPFRKHEHLDWTLSDGMSWRYKDTRRFGFVKTALLPGKGQSPSELNHLGPEPLTSAFSADWLYRVTRNRKRSTKNLLLDQTIVAGIGNIYASEGLFRARLHPERTGDSLTYKECKTLVSETKTVLREALTAGGSTISDYRQIDGTEGRFHHNFLVYDKAGTVCPRCGAGSSIVRLVLAGRSSYLCPGCQH